ncbi:radical SAM protein [Methylomonas sp. EFPC3]|uniref:radical SAM protein n=1 Tax=Methylomonas TaxID=416 RepID=UPI00112E999B|nr:MULTISPECIES: radical SAM protein [Methylomonas]TPQ29272.1 radical SAM protein [Methylomonas koyamae]WFP48736.1 radical SAM protein [Methylomonas sp. EFPC3]
MPKTLSTNDHDRNIAGLRYVYPVISRRAGGLSIGINFNPNNACNWHCVYCQVPGLQRGNAPELDFALLEQELREFLNQVLNGDFYQRFNIPEPQRVIKDIAISGNGEPTSLKNFDRAADLIGGIASQAGLFPESRYVLISNGSLIHQSAVQQGLRTLARYNGELWFKLDSATESGRKLINQTGQSQQKLLEHLRIAAKLCRTKLQTCVFSYRFAWSDQEKQAYLSLLKQLRQMDIKIEQVMLYSLARPSLQAEAAELAKASTASMDALAADVSALGYDVSVSY